MAASVPQVAAVCNICGGDRFHARLHRPHAVCAGCGAAERTRLLWLILIARNLVRPGMRVLHLAPEAAIAGRLRAVLGDGYDPADIAPEEYPDVPGVRRLDLVAEAARLPSRHYDLVIHSHVMEHVAGNVTAILYHLTRALTEDGRQVCCIPILRDVHSEEDLGPLEADEADRRFGRYDHVRRFGELDVARTLGMIFALPERYDLSAEFDAATLRGHGLPAMVATRWSPHSVLCLGRRDLLLRD